MMKKLICLFSLAVLIAPILKAQSTDSLIRKVNPYRFELKDNPQFFKSGPFELKVPSFTNPLEMYTLTATADSNILALNPPRIKNADQDNMPVLIPGHNFPMRNLLPENTNHYYLRIYNPNQKSRQDLPPTK